MVYDVTNSDKIEQFARRYINDNSGLTMRTKNLRDSTKAKTIRTSNGVIVKLSNNAKYAWAQDQGSGLHGRNRRKYLIAGNPFLRFRWKGQIVYRRYGMHPGVRPTRFLYNATDATGRTVVAWLETKKKDVARNF